MCQLKSPCGDHLTNNSQGRDIGNTKLNAERSLIRVKVSHWGPDWFRSAQVKWYKSSQIAGTMPERGVYRPFQGRYLLWPGQPCSSCLLTMSPQLLTYISSFNLWPQTIQIPPIFRLKTLTQSCIVHPQLGIFSTCVLWASHPNIKVATIVLQFWVWHPPKIGGKHFECFHLDSRNQ